MAISELTKLRIRRAMNDPTAATEAVNAVDAANTYVEGVTPGTVTASKAVIVDSNARLTALTLASLNSVPTSAEHGAGAIGTGVAPATSRRTENGTIITEIKVDLKGLACKGDAAKDAIGLAAGGVAFIGKYVTATCGIVYRAELICIQSPGEGTATITADIDLARDASGTIAYDGTVGNVVVDTGGIAAGKMHVKNDPVMTANDYLYLVEGDTAASTGVYNAGQVIVRLYGHAVLT